MNLESLFPPADVAADLAALDATVKADTSGVKTRRLTAYLTKAESQAQELALRSTDFEEKTFAGRLAEAFGAARGIMQSAWQKLHGGELTT